eukprot:3227975-Prymnesium_polylepis.1
MGCLRPLPPPAPAGTASRQLLHTPPAPAPAAHSGRGRRGIATRPRPALAPPHHEPPPRARHVQPPQPRP